MARGAPFPRNIADFEADERVSYSTVDQKYLLVDDDGEEWEFNEGTGKWFQPITDEQIAAYQSAYGGGGNDNFEAEAEAPKAQKKRKAPTAADPEPKKPRVQENRGIYITNLPLDTTVDEIDAEFSKYGLIDLSHDGSKRIKMYTDDEGNFKGEALVIYYKKDSVGMAINMMDDSWFRPGQGPNIRVQEADMSYKKTQDSEETKKALTREQRKAQGANRAELSRKLADWSDDEDEVAKETFVPKNQWAKIAIVKHAFTLKELEEDKDARADIQADMREEGEKHGKVTNVVIYDLEPEGIVTIRFEDADSAESFIKACNGRNFDGRKLIVTAAQSNPKGKFKKSARYLNEEEEEELLNDLVNGQ